MKRSLRTLETLQASLASTSGGDADRSVRSLLEVRQLKEAAREHQLAKLSPYKRAEYLCLECVAELRGALRDIEELQHTLHGGSTTSTITASSNGLYSSPPLSSTSREERAAADNDAADVNDLEDERAQLLGGGSHRRRQRQPPARQTGEAALLEQELLSARQRARRAHQRLQHLQRDAARLSKSSSSVMNCGLAEASVDAAVSPHEGPSSSSSALETLDWQRAEKHVELAKQWYRDLFGVHVIASLVYPAVSSSPQLNRPAQPQQSMGSMSYFGQGANPLPTGVVSASGIAPQNASAVEGQAGTVKGADPNRAASGEYVETDPNGGDGTLASLAQTQIFRSAREDAEFDDFFASVKANDELMEAALDRLSAGLARLLDNAHEMQNELTTQEQLLRDTEARINENETDIANMNRRLRRAIRDINSSSICVYVLCLMVLLLILGVLLRVVS